MCSGIKRFSTFWTLKHNFLSRQITSLYLWRCHVEHNKPIMLLSFCNLPFLEKSHYEESHTSAISTALFTTRDIGKYDESPLFRKFLHNLCCSFELGKWSEVMWNNSRIRHHFPNQTKSKLVSMVFTKLLYSINKMWFTADCCCDL